jgi:DUF4097 and DUF4098 domain-containing protein YvlB
MKTIMACGALWICMGADVWAETIQRTFNVSPGQKLVIDLKTGGSIQITGWDKPVVTVDAKIEGRGAADIRVDIQQTSQGVEITSDTVRRGNSHSSDTEFQIRVPSRFDVKIDTMGGGIGIRALEGRIAGKTMGGGLKLQELRGYVDLTTMGGEITLLDSEVDGKLHTMGGEVLFQNVVGSVKGSSMGGNVVYRNVQVLDRSGKASKAESVGEEVNISTMGGEIRVDDAPLGANVSTMGGDIEIRSAGKYVKAKTMGGDIRIHEVDGSVSAATMGGDIDVRVTGTAGDHGVTLSSMGGEITLYVPGDLSMEFDVTLAYTRNSGKNFEIQSDFGVQVSDTNDWDYSKGSARKYLYGKGSYLGGKNLIKIETTNGNIQIRRAK